MTDAIGAAAHLTAAPPRRGSALAMRLRAGSEYLAIPALAVLVASGLFGLFLLAVGKSPLIFLDLIWVGGFGSAFSWGNTLARAAPLVLTALTVAVPAQLGLTIIGGEGALVLGGFAAAAVAVPFLSKGDPCRPRAAPRAAFSLSAV